MALQDALRQYRSFLGNYEQELQTFPQRSAQNAYDFQLLNRYSNKPHVTLAQIRSELGFDENTSDEQLYSHIRNRFKDYDDAKFEQAFGHLKPLSLRPPPPEPEEKKKDKKADLGPAGWLLRKGVLEPASAAGLWTRASFTHTFRDPKKKQELIAKADNLLEQGADDAQLREFLKNNFIEERWDSYEVDGRVPIYKQREREQIEKAYDRRFGKLTGAEILEQLRTDAEKGQKAVAKEWHRYEKHREATEPDVESQWHPAMLHYNLVEQLGRMLPGVAAAAIPGAGIPLGSAYIGSSVYGGALKDGYDRGLSHEEAHQRALFQSIAESATEMVPLGVIMKPVKTALKTGKVAEEAGKASIKSKETVTKESMGMVQGILRDPRFQHVLKASGAEGLQEFTVESLNTLYDKLNDYEDRSVGEWLNDVAYAGTLGALMGGTLGSVTSGFVEGSAKRIQDQQKQKQEDYVSTPPTETAQDPTTEESEMADLQNTVQEYVKKAAENIVTATGFENNTVLQDSSGAVRGRIERTENGFKVFDNQGKEVADAASLSEAQFEAQEILGADLTQTMTEPQEEQDRHEVVKNMEEESYQVYSPSGRLVGENLPNVEAVQEVVAESHDAFANNLYLTDSQGMIQGRIAYVEDQFSVYDNKGQNVANAPEYADAMEQAEELFGMLLATNQTEKVLERDGYTVLLNEELNTFNIVQNASGRLVRANQDRASVDSFLNEMSERTEPEVIKTETATLTEVDVDKTAELHEAIQNEPNVERFYKVKSGNRNIGFVGVETVRGEVGYVAYDREGKVAHVADVATVEEAVAILKPQATVKPQKQEVAEPNRDNWAINQEQSQVERDAQNQLVRDVRTFENGVVMEIVPGIKVTASVRTEKMPEKDEHLKKGTYLGGESGQTIYRVFRGKEGIRGKEQVASFPEYEKAVAFRDQFTEKQQTKHKDATKSKTATQLQASIGNQLAETQDTAIPYGEAKPGRFGNYVVEARADETSGDVYFEVTDPGERTVQKRGTVKGRGVGHITVNPETDQFVAHTGGIRSEGAQELGSHDTIDAALDDIVAAREHAMTDYGYQVREDAENNSFVVEDPEGQIVDEYELRSQAQRRADEYNEQQRNQTTTYEAIEIRKDEARVRQELEEQGLTGETLESEVAEQSKWTDFRVMNEQTNQVVGEVSQTDEGTFIGEPRHDFDALEDQTFDTLEEARDAVVESHREYLNQRIADRYARDAEQTAHHVVRKIDADRAQRTLDRIQERKEELQDERTQKLIKTLQEMDPTRTEAQPVDVTESLLETDPDRIKITPRQRLRVQDGVKSITMENAAVQRSLVQDHAGNPAFEFGKKVAELHGWHVEGTRVVTSHGRTVTDKDIKEAVAAEHTLGNAVLFSKGHTQHSGTVRKVAAEEVEALLDTLNIDQKFRRKIHLVEKPEDLPNQKDVEEFRSSGTRGYITTGSNEVYINLMQPTTLAEVENTLAHELIGHLGLDNVVGKQSWQWFERMYDELKGEYSEAFQEIYKELIRRYPEAINDRYTEITEFVAIAVEKRGWQQRRTDWQKIQDWVKRLAAKVMEWLRGKGGMHKEYSDRFTMNDLYEILSMSEASLRSRESIVATPQRDTQDLGEFSKLIYGFELESSDFLQTGKSFAQQPENVQEALRALVRESNLKVELQGMSWEQLKSDVFLRVLNGKRRNNRSARIMHAEDPRLLNMDLNRLGELLSHQGIAGIEQNGESHIFNYFHNTNLRPNVFAGEAARPIGEKRILEAEADLVPEIQLQPDKSYKMVPPPKVSTRKPPNLNKFLSSDYWSIFPHVQGRKEVSSELRRIVRRIAHQMRQPKLLNELGTINEARIVDAVFEYFGEANGRRFLKDMGIAGTFGWDGTYDMQFTTYPTDNVTGTELLHAIDTASSKNYRSFSKDVGEHSPLSPREKHEWQQNTRSWAIIKKWLLRGGRIPPEIYQNEYKEKVGEELLGHIMPDYLLQELRAKLYPGKTWAQIPQDMHTKIIKYLREEIPVHAVSGNQKLQVVLRDVRKLIDQKTNENIELLRKARRELRNRAQHIILHPTEKNKQIGEKIDYTLEKYRNLIQTLKDKRGKYVHRAYQAHNNPRWVKQVHKGKLRKTHFEPAVEELKKAYWEIWQKDNPDKAATAKDRKAADKYAREHAAAILTKSTETIFMDPHVITKMGEESMDAIALKAMAIYRRKKDITPAVRKMLGEYTDARAVISQTITKQSEMAASMAFQVTLLQNYLGTEILHDRPDESSPAYEQFVQIDDSSTTELLRGMWINRDVVEGIAEQDVPGYTGTNFAIKLGVTTLGTVKVGLTVFSFTTQSRNIIANPWLMFQAGMFAPTVLWRHRAKIGKAFKAIVLSKVNLEDKAKFKDDYQVYNKYGIVGDSVAGGQFHEIRKSINLHPVKEGFIWVAEKLLKTLGVREDQINRNIENIRERGRIGLDLFQRMYAFGDEAFKIAVFEEVLRTQVKERHEKLGDFKNEKGELDKEAAYRYAATFVTDNMMAYSTVSRVIRKASVLPLTASFPTFTAELIRTGKNNAKDILIKTTGVDAQRSDSILKVLKKLGKREFIKDKERLKIHRKEGFKHAAYYSVPYVTLAVLVPQLVRAFWSLFGDLEEYDELLEAYKEIAPWWAKFASPIIYGYDKEQKRILYWNYTSLIPQYYFAKPFAIFNQVGDTMSAGEAWNYVRQELTAPFTDLDITAQAVLEAWAGVDKATGQKLYNEADSWWDVRMKGAEHIIDSTTPGTIRSFVNMYRAASGEQKRSGQEYTIPGEIGAMLGFRTTILNLEDSIYFSGRALKRMESAIVTNFNEVIYEEAIKKDPQNVSDARIMRAVDKAQQLSTLNFNRLRGVVRAARVLEIPNKTIFQSLNNAGVSRRDIGLLLMDKDKKFMPSKESLARKLKTAPPRYRPIYNSSYVRARRYSWSGEID